MSDDDVPHEGEQQMLDEMRHVSAEDSLSFLSQLCEDEAEARRAAEAANRQAAGILDGCMVGTCPIEIRLPPGADDASDGDDMILVDPGEGF